MRTKKVFFVLPLILLISIMIVGNVTANGGGNPGAIWTTNEDCGDITQDVNLFEIGEVVYINGSNFLAGTYNWAITGQPGGASGDPSKIVKSGTVVVGSGGNFCFAAYTVLSDDWGEYTVDVGTKNDNYRVDRATETPPTDIPTPTPPTETPQPPEPPCEVGCPPHADEELLCSGQIGMISNWVRFLFGIGPVFHIYSDAGNFSVRNLTGEETMAVANSTPAGTRWVVDTDWILFRIYDAEGNQVLDICKRDACSVSGWSYVIGTTLQPGFAFNTDELTYWFYNDPLFNTYGDWDTSNTAAVAVMQGVNNGEAFDLSPYIK